MAEVIGDAGIAVLPERSDQIGNALKLLIDDDERIATLSARARERIRQFRWPRIASHYDEVMEQALAAQHAPEFDGTATAVLSRRK